MNKKMIIATVLLCGTFAFANTNNNNVSDTKSEGLYYCEVTDGLASGEATGKTMRQACRRARRAMRHMAREM